MPNYCQNLLIIVGAEADLDHFAARAVSARGGPLSLTSLDPLQQQGEQPSADLERQQWGTLEIDESSVTAHRSCRELRYEFDSAWTPPETWLESVSRMFPRLRMDLHYMEPGREICGIRTCVNGRTLTAVRREGQKHVRRMAGMHFGFDPYESVA